MFGHSLRKIGHASTTALVFVGLWISSARAQTTTPKVFYACYNKGTGTVYRIKEPGTPQACASTQHVEFSWTDGIAGLKVGDAAAGDLGGTYPSPFISALRGNPLAATAPSAGQVLTWNGAAWAPTTPTAGITDHGALGGLGDDDHTQYVLLEGTRSSTIGFAVNGQRSNFGIPVSGPGTRLMWAQSKGAFRAGSVSGTEWDIANVGLSSVAMGIGTIASGGSATALGFGTIASGGSATALGSNTTASGNRSTAIGSQASTNGQAGSFVYGDGSSQTDVTSTAPNQFVVRAAGGTIFYSAGDLSAGVTLATGAGSWASVSDVRRKENFRDLDADTVLARIARMDVPEWNYKSQDSSVRHVGPTAQDFYAAFRLSASDTTITTTDIDGIALLAIKALERRTAQVSTLEARVAELELRLSRLVSSTAGREPRPRNR
jgi:endosialidase-like protein/trimeric autotransporter adhesin